VLQREFPLVTPLNLGAPGRPGNALLRNRAFVLDAIEQATHDAGLDRRAFRCPSGDLPALLLCFDGFERVLTPLARNDQLRRIVKSWSESPDCGTKDVGRYDAEKCLAEAMLVRLLDDPREAVEGIIDGALRQLRVAEERAGEDGSRSHELVVKTAEFLYRSTNHRSRSGFQLDPSSIPPGEGKKWWWMHLLPYYAGGGLGLSSTQVGWQPIYHWRGPFSIVTPLPVDLTYQRIGLIDTNPYEWSLGITPSVGTTFAKGWLNQIAVGVRFQSRSSAGERGFAGLSIREWYRPMPEASTVALFGKLRLSAYYVPKSPLTGDRRVMGAIGLADVNGILHLLLR
jgi:hypothetical protein